MNRHDLTKILNLYGIGARDATCLELLKIKRREEIGGSWGRQNIVKSLRVPFDRQSDCMLLVGP